MLWEVIPTALVAAFSPSTLLIVTGLLGLKRPILNATVFLASAAVVAIGIGVAVVLGLQGLGYDDSRKHPTVPPALDLILGLTILAFATHVARRPPRPGRGQKQKPEQREMRLLVVVGLGLYTGSPSPLYLTCLHSIAKARPGTVAALLSVVVIAAIVLSMAELPIALYLAEPERCAAVLSAVNAWLARHGRLVALTAAGIVGAYFVVIGIVQLV